MNYKILTLAVVLLTCIFVGCSKDNDDNNDTGQRKVVFKAEASAGSTITTAVYGAQGDGQTTATGLSGTTWTSPEITVPANALSVAVAVGGTGVDVSSTLKVQIFVNGELKKEGTSSGTVLSASASYGF